MSYGGFDTIPNLTGITARLTITRASGYAPCAVHVHAESVTATFSDGGAAVAALLGRAFDAYLDLDFSWDFGDSGGTELFTHPVTGATANANSDQKGPQAAYLYRTTGTKTITLTVRGWTGAAYVTDQTTTLLVPGYHQYEVMGGPTGGSYTLTLNGATTGTIAYNAQADARPRAGDGSGTPWNSVQAALDAALGAGKVRVTRAGGTLRFAVLQVGAETESAWSAITASAAGLTGGTTPSIVCVRHQAGTTAAGVTVSDHPAVADSSREIYVDSVGGNDANPGTFASPKQTLSAITTFVPIGPGVTTNNKRVFLKRGSHWTGAITWRCPQHLQVLAYGTGARPIIEATGSGSAVQVDSRYADAVNGLYVEGVDFRSTGSAARAVFFFMSNNGTNTNPYGLVRNVALVDCAISGGTSARLQVSFSDAVGFGVFVWGGVVDSGSNAGQGILSNCMGPMAVVGTYLSGGNGNAVFDHPWYPTVSWQLVGRWLDFGPVTLLNYCVNGNCELYSSGGRGGDGILFDGCDVTGTNNGFDLSNSANTATNTTLDRVVLQNNAVHVGQIGSQGYGVLCYNNARTVIRDNGFYNNRLEDYVSGSADAVLSFYRNNVYRPASVGTVSITLSPAAAGGCVRANTFYSARVLDSTTGLINYTAAGLSEYAVDLNRWFTPYWVSGGAVKPFRDTGGASHKTFAEWQGLGADVNGRMENPNWTSPAAGNFGRRPRRRAGRLMFG